MTVRRAEPATRATVAIAAAVVAVVLAISTEPTVLVTGALTGLTYAGLAAGLVVVYRVSRVINVAHAELGALAAMVHAKLVIDYGWNWVAAGLAACGAGAAAGAVIELAVVRRLFDQPRLVLLVATTGVASILYVARLNLTFDHPATTFPLPFRRHLDIGDVVIHAPGLLVLTVLPAVLTGLSVFLRRTPYGVVLRSVADNPDAARLAGISARRMSTLAWAIGGGLGAAAVVAAAGLLNLSPAIAQPVSGPSLLLRALAAALVGRMSSLPLTIAGGVALGTVEAALISRFDTGVGNLALAGFVLAVVLVSGRHAMGDKTVAVARPRTLPASLQDLGWLRVAPRLAVAAAVVAAVLVPVVVSAPSSQQTFSRVAVFAMIVVSATVLGGWAGQLSLGQYGFVGWGAASTAALVTNGVPFALAVVVAGAGGVLVALLVGLPALRVGGVFLAVTTLAFAVAVHAFVVPRLLGTGNRTVTVPRVRWGPIDLADQRSYYYACLAALGLTVVTANRLRRSGVGRSILAVRDDAAAAAAYSVSPARTKLVAFGFSGLIASVAGALLAGLDVQVSAVAFGPDESLRVVAAAVIGGLGSIGGAILGALWTVGVPALTGGGDTARLLATAPFLLVILLYLPGGFVELVERARFAAAGWAARRFHPTRPALASASPVTGIPATPSAMGAPGAEPLHVREVVVSFGGVDAVDGVSLDVHAGEIVGLIGPNGAGKSTLLNAISGLVPATGSIVLFGERVDRRTPAARAHRGLARTFQHTRLFDSLTVHETVMVALESRAPTRLGASLLGLPDSRRAERAKAASADEYVALMGLGAYRDTYISELSTGTRRVVELAGALALGHRMLLLDEPSAGLAQADAEALGPLLLDVRAALGASVLIVEHDVALIAAICDRVYVMSSGRIVSEPDLGALVPGLGSS